MSSLALTALLHLSMMVPGDTNSYKDAVKTATTTGRPIVVMVGTEWCPACQMMKTSIMPEVKKDGGLAKVAYAQVDADKEGALAGQILRGNLIPQLVIYVKSDKGWLKDVMVGAHSASEVEEFIRENMAAEPVRLGKR